MKTILQTAETESGRAVWAKEGMIALFGAVFLSIFAQVKIPLGFTPVPLSLQTLAILLLAVGMGSKRSMSSTVVYLGFASVGLPVLAGGAGGFAHLIGPTAGYIAGFVVLAGLAGFSRKYSGLVSFCILFGASIVQMLMGTLWLASFTGLASAFSLGFWPFLFGDLVKVCIAYQVGSWIRR